MVDPDRIGMLTEGFSFLLFRDSSMVDPDGIGMLTEGFSFLLFRDSSMVEHSAVNRRVASSSLARGASRDKNSILMEMG